MFSRVAIVLFVVAVAEYLAFRRAGAAIGIGNTVFVVVISLMIGVGALRNQIARLAAQLSERIGALADVDPANKDQLGRLTKGSSAAVGVLGALLLMAPGLITSAVGLAFLVPTIQNLVAPLLPPVRFLQSSTGLFTTSFSRRPQRAEGDIVDVDVVSTESYSASSVDDDDPLLPPGGRQAQP